MNANEKIFSVLRAPRVSEKTARLQEVNVLVSVNIPHVGVRRFFNGDREGIIERQVVLNPTGDVDLGFIGQFF